MAYFKINEIDFSKYVNELKVGHKATYNAQTNAAGDTVVDFINKKYTLEVGFIPLNDSQMAELQAVIDDIMLRITFRDPRTNQLIEGLHCILPETEIEYYTIQVGKVMYKAFTLTFTQL